MSEAVIVVVVVVVDVVVLVVVEVVVDVDDGNVGRTISDSEVGTGHPLIQDIRTL